MAKSKNLAEISTTELQSEIRRRERELKALHKRRERIARQLEEIDAEIGMHGGDLSKLASSGGRKRPRNESNLADALADVLRDQTMSVTQLTTAVQEAGYRTTSPNFRTIVNQTLLKDKRFKRVARGQYTVSGGRAGAGEGGGRPRGKKRRTKRSSRKS